MSVTVPQEFAFLASDAHALGLPSPIIDVRRIAVPAGAGPLSALSWGDDPGTTFLHGGGLNAHTWDSTIIALGAAGPGEGGAVLALDLPGHGDSAWRDDADYSPGTIAPAVIEAIELTADRPQLVVGQSLGGLTAAVVAGSRPDLVRGTVIIDALPFSPADLPADQPNQVRDFLSGPTVFGSRAEIVDRALQFGFGPNRSAVERGVVLNTNVQGDGTVVYKHHLGTLGSGAAASPDFSAVWASLEAATTPTLLVAASHGFLSPALVTEFTRRVPRGIVVEIESGHNVQEEHPLELARLIHEFDGETR